MECLLSREHSGASVGERSQLQRVLIGLGSAIDEEQLVVVVAADAPEPFSQFHLQFVLHGVAIEPQQVGLFRQFFDIMRVAVADRDNGVATIEVEILLPFVVPHVAALALHDVHVEERINIKQFHVVFF